MPRWAVLLLFLCTGAVACAADVPAAPPAEDQKIEALLAHLATQQDLRFVRNGADHDAATAVKFLRGKWDRQRADIKTVRDFIDKVATRSSTTGQPYLIKFKDGRTVECREFLRQLLTAP